MVRRGVPRSQCRHDAIRAQSAPCPVQGKQSAGGRGRRRCLLRRGEWRSRRRRRRRHALRWFWLFRLQHFPHCLRRRTGRLKLRDHGIGIHRRRGRRGEIAGDMDHLHRDGCRLEVVERVSDRETAVGSGHGDGAGRLATWPQGRTGIGSWRHRFELNLHCRRCRLETIQGKRGATRQTSPRYGNHDDTTHDASATLSRLTAAIPASTIGASGQRCNHAGLDRYVMVNIWIAFYKIYNIIKILGSIL